MKDKGENHIIVFPPLEGGEYIINLLKDVGPAISNGMGIVEIPPMYLESYLNVCQLDLSGWECETILKLSKVYVNQHYISSDPNCISPFLAEENLPTREQVNDKLKNFFAAFKKKQ